MRQREAPVSPRQDESSLSPSHSALYPPPGHPLSSPSSGGFQKESRCSHHTEQDGNFQHWNTVRAGTVRQTCNLRTPEATAGEL